MYQTKNTKRYSKSFLPLPFRALTTLTARTLMMVGAVAAVANPARMKMTAETTVATAASHLVTATMSNPLVVTIEMTTPLVAPLRALGAVVTVTMMMLTLTPALTLPVKMTEVKIRSLHTNPGLRDGVVAVRMSQRRNHCTMHSLTFQRSRKAGKADRLVEKAG